MDIGKNFRDGFEVIKKNLVEAVVGYILMGIVAVLSLGVLAPVVYTGYILMLLKAKRKKAISVNDIFSALPRFWALWGLSSVIFLVCFLLSLTIIGIIPAVFLGTWWMYSIFFLVDKKQKVFEAMGSSAALVRKNNVWLHILFLIMLSVVNNIGAYVFFVGILFTGPLAAAAYAAAYDNLAVRKK